MIVNINNTVNVNNKQIFGKYYYTYITYVCNSFDLLENPVNQCQLSLHEGIYSFELDKYKHLKIITEEKKNRTELKLCAVADRVSRSKPFFLRKGFFNNFLGQMVNPS